MIEKQANEKFDKMKEEFEQAQSKKGGISGKPAATGKSGAATARDTVKGTGAQPSENSTGAATARVGNITTGSKRPTTGAAGAKPVTPGGAKIRSDSKESQKSKKSGEESGSVSGTVAQKIAANLEAKKKEDELRRAEAKAKREENERKKKEEIEAKQKAL